MYDDFFFFQITLIVPFGSSRIVGVVVYQRVGEIYVYIYSTPSLFSFCLCHKSGKEP